MKLYPILIALLLIVPATQALTVIPHIGTTENPYQPIEVIFDFDFWEEVNIHDYTLTWHGVAGTEVPLIKLYQIDNTVVYQPNQLLENGDYTFYLDASTDYSEDASAQTEFTVDFDYMDIDLIHPELGMFNETPFIVEIFTEYESLNCRMGPWANSYLGKSIEEQYTFLDNMDPVGIKPTQSWTANLTLDPEDQKPYLFICSFNDPRNLNKAMHEIGYDPSNPVITIDPSTHTIVDRRQPTVEIEVQTDDDSVCAYSGDPLVKITSSNTPNPSNKSTYNTSRFINVSYSDVLATRPSETLYYNYVATCTNLAGFISEKNFTGVVDLETTLTVTKIEPTSDYLTSTTVDLVVETNLQAEFCNYGTTGMRNTNGDYTTWDITLTLTEGENDVEIYCESVEDDHTETFTFTVDTSKPTTPVIEAESECDLEELSASWEAEDNESGIDHYNYSIYKGNTKIFPENKLWHVTSRKYATVDDLDLDNGDMYTWKVFAVNNAGIKGDAGSETVQPKDPDDDACDDIPPEVSINTVHKEPGLTIFNISCEDEMSGCKNKFNFSLKDTATATCTFENQKTIGQSITISKTQYFCYWVEDKEDNVENNGKRSKKIQVESDNTNPPNNETPTPPSCSNNVKDGDETDVDCGGICDACELDEECISKYDCNTLYCDAGVCATPACDDGITNGNETDEDCGGNCPACDVEERCILDTDCAGDLECNALRECEVPYGVDTDLDELPDQWEYANFGTRTGANPDDDTDRDGADNLEEYLSGTDPNDETDRPEKSSILPTILLILGILLVVGGGVLLFLTRDTHKETFKSDEPIMVQNRLERKPVKSTAPVEQEHKKTDAIVSKLYKKRQSQKKKESMKNLFSSFEEKQDQGMKPLKEAEISESQRDIIAFKKKMAEKKSQIAEKKEPAATKKQSKQKKEGYINVLDLKKQQDMKKQDSKKQVFQKLEGLSKKKTVSKLGTTTKKQSGTKPVKSGAKTAKPAIASKPSTKSKSMTNKEVFDKLAKLANQPKIKVNTTMKGPSKVSADKMLDIFANVTDKKQINQDVFKVILSQLLTKGKITKSTVNSLLFRFRDQKLLTTKEVTKIMDDLKLM